MATLDELKLMLQQIKDKIDESPRVGDPVAPTQVVTVTGMSDIDDNLGLINAGEFRAGTGIPGYGFSGVRIASPAVSYNNQTWNIVGVESDTLQFGIRASDGVAVWAGGIGMLSRGGIYLRAGNDTDADNIHITWTDSFYGQGSTWGQVKGEKLGTIADGRMQLQWDLYGYGNDAGYWSVTCSNIGGDTDTESRAKYVLSGDSTQGFVDGQGQTYTGPYWYVSLYEGGVTNLFGAARRAVEFNMMKQAVEFRVWGSDTTSPILFADPSDNKLYYRGNEIATA